MSETYDTILALLDEMGATSKSTEKVALLQETLKWQQEDLDVLQAVFIYALSPLLSFGISDISDIEPVKSPGFDADSMWNVLLKLAVRELTGQEAKDAIAEVLGSASESAVEVFKRILNKNLKSGAAAKTVNKVFRDLVYIHPYMRCSLLNAKTLTGVKFPCYSQTKLDGMYVDIRVDADKVTYFSREGHILPFNEVSRDKALITFASGQTLQGEALVLNDAMDGWIDRSKNNGYLNSDNIDLSRVLFVCWDVIPNIDHTFHASIVPYQTRLSVLYKIVHHVTQNVGRFILMCETKECEDIDDVINHFKEQRAMGQEGTVVKNKNMAWKDGTSKDQLKLKVSAVGDLKIVGWNEGKDKWEGYVGSLICQSQCGKLEVSVNCKTDAFRKKATESIDKWVESGTIVSVVYNDIVENELKPELKALYLPRMETDDVRYDKTEADTLERLQDILDNFEFLV